MPGLEADNVGDPPNGWNKEMTDVHFFVPTGYPHANPDCFYVDADVRLVNGSLPANAQLQQLGDLGQALWFSYHLSRPWKPGRDRLLTWVATIAARLAEAR